MLRERLRRGETRLVTLVGPPGVGKTLIAQHVAGSLAGEFRDGAAFVALDAVREVELVPAAVARSLAVREQPGHTLIEAIKAHLGPQRVLLVLDNFEHVLAAATVVSDLLGACPELTVLVTSRAALHLRWEVQAPVEPLPAPSDRQSPAGSEGDAAPERRDTPLNEIADSPAVQLFLARAGAVRPSLALTAETAGDIAAICARLDGLPLAIELAAARAKLLSPREIVEHLTSRLAFLTGGYQDLPERHRTLRAALDWSYELLTPEQRRAFRMLSVFAGGCALDALEAVALASGEEAAPGASGGASLDTVDALVDHSLVRREEAADGTTRLRMLESIREYAAEKLEAAGEGEAARLRLAAWCLSLVHLAERRMTGPEQVTWLRRLDDELGNLRAALQWSLERDHVAIGLELAGGLGQFWDIRGHFAEGTRWLTRLLARGASAPGRARAPALYAAAALAERQGNFADARRWAEETVTLSRESGDDRRTALALKLLGLIAEDEPDYPRAVAYLEESLALGRSLGEATLIRIPLYNLGRIDLMRGETERARARFQEALALARETNDLGGIATNLTALGTCARRAGQALQARAYLGEALDVRRRLGELRGVADTLRQLATLEVEEGDFHAAAAHAGEALALAREIGHPWGVVMSSEMLAEITRGQGDFEAARGFAHATLSAAQKLGDRKRIQAALLQCAALLAVTDRGRDAARIYATAEALREALGFALDQRSAAELERLTEALRHRLGETAFAAVWAEGTAWTADEAIAAALLALQQQAGATADPERAGCAAVPADRAPGGRLSTREREVLRLLAAGQSNRQIAERFVLSERTVEHHVAAIYRKLGVHSRVEATAYAMRHGLEGPA